jgi:peptide/nickel transport system permease protein
VRVAATTLAACLLCTAMATWAPGFGQDEELLDPRYGSGAREALLRSHEGERNPLTFCIGWFRRAAGGDFGFSRSLNRPVRELLSERTPATAMLMLSGIVASWIFAAALAAPAAAFRLRAAAAVTGTVSTVAACLPAAAISVVLFQCGASARWMLVLILFPRIYFYLFNLLRQAYAEPQVLFARAKGLPGWRIFLRHVLVPARGRLAALAAVSVNMAFGAAIAVEAICDLPGIGQLAWKAALARDLPVLVTVTLAVALMSQAANLLADAAGAPRKVEA